MKRFLIVTSEKKQMLDTFRDFEKKVNRIKHQFRWRSLYVKTVMDKDIK